MTAALRIFADLVIAEPFKVARISIHDAVRDLGVSVASANRFAKVIGFSGYAEFRTELIRSFEPAFEPVKRLEVQTARMSTSHDVVTASLTEDIANLQATANLLTTEATNDVVTAIVKAENVIIFGADNGASCAAIFCNGLLRLRENVTCTGNYDGPLGIARHLGRLGPKDIAVAIAFPNYIKDVIQLANTAKEIGVPLVAITDSHRSPLAPIADMILFSQSERQFASVSNTSIIALIEGIVAAVAHRTPDAVSRATQLTSLELPWLANPTEPAPARKSVKTPVADGKGRTPARQPGKS